MEVKEIRLKALLTQNEFANALGLHVETVRAWEQGKHIPSLKAKRKLKEFCKGQGIDYDRKG